jgi:uncharacterized protein YjeT (DUF2065 family)
MGALRIVMIAAASLFLLEGFMFSMFPEQVLQALREAEPRMLQIAGLIESVVAASLLASLYFQAV